MLTTGYNVQLMGMMINLKYLRTIVMVSKSLNLWLIYYDNDINYFTIIRYKYELRVNGYG